MQSADAVDAMSDEDEKLPHCALPHVVVTAPWMSQPRSAGPFLRGRVALYAQYA